MIGSLERGTHMWITMKDLKQMDEISIHTQNSEYRFRVTDPTKGRGLLSGGLLGEAQHEASLCYRGPTNNQQSQFSARFEIGCCAFFYVYIRDSLRQLATSEIKDVSLARVPTLVSTDC
jgi:hypothetical protein